MCGAIASLTHALLLRLIQYSSWSARPYFLRNNKRLSWPTFHIARVPVYVFAPFSAHSLTIKSRMRPYVWKDVRVLIALASRLFTAMLDLCLVAWVLSLILRRTWTSCDAPVCVCNMTTSEICDPRRPRSLTYNSRSLQFRSKGIRVYAFGVPAAESLKFRFPRIYTTTKPCRFFCHFTQSVCSSMSTGVHWN